MKVWRKLKNTHLLQDVTLDLQSCSYSLFMSCKHESVSTSYSLSATLIALWVAGSNKWLNQRLNMTQTWVYFQAFKALLEQQDALCGSDSDFLFLLDRELQHRRPVIHSNNKGYVNSRKNDSKGSFLVRNVRYKKSYRCDSLRQTSKGHILDYVVCQLTEYFLCILTSLCTLFTLQSEHTPNNWDLRVSRNQRVLLRLRGTSWTSCRNIQWDVSRAVSLHRAGRLSCTGWR